MTLKASLFLMYICRCECATPAYTSSKDILNQLFSSPALTIFLSLCLFLRLTSFIPLSLSIFASFFRRLPFYFFFTSSYMWLLLLDPPTYPHNPFHRYSVATPPGSRQCGEITDIVWPAPYQKALPADIHPHPGGTAVLLHARPGQRGLPHHDGTAGGDGVRHRCPQTAPVWPHW